jgi:hypothetical protein
MKWSDIADKKALQLVQAVLTKHLATIKGITGFKHAQRVVCGGCLDFKVRIQIFVLRSFVVLSALHPARSSSLLRLASLLKHGRQLHSHLRKIF